MIDKIVTTKAIILMANVIFLPSDTAGFSTVYSTVYLLIV